ncbi:hypothetical protein ACIPLC_31705 [Kitasatospora sp. NPDC086801]|uniref:hypothetical protein n=1 Tax=Kitasatospora sp. NPDC086801 TaxID=3364066 RepID=UPI003818CCE4
MSDWYTPAPPGLDVGPLPKRSAVGLALQFTLQWLYLVPWSVVAVADVVGSLLGNSDSNIRRGLVDHTLTPRRYHLERRGTQQEWEAWTDEILERRSTEALRAERQRRAWNAGSRYKHKETDPAFDVEKRYYRSIGAGGVAVVAARRGWDVDWRKTYPKSTVRLVYRKPLDA